MELTDEQKKLLLSHAADHEGHAQCVLVLYPGLYKHSSTHGWLRYSGTHWETEMAEPSVERAITNTLQRRRALFAANEDFKSAKQCASWRSNVTGAKAQLAKAAEVAVSMSDFDRSPNRVNCKNGVLNLKTGDLEPHHSGQLYTYCLPVAYEPEAAEPDVWLEFLQSVGLSEDVVDYLRLAVGYSLTGNTNEEVLFYLYGPTRSGKGTFTEVLNTMLGELASGVDMQTFTAKRYGDTSNFDLAPLKAKRLITASESQRHGQLNPATIKKITGGDEIYCSFKRKDHFSYRPQFKIWLTSNFPVNTDVDDDAAWGRVRVIHFPTSFLGKEDKGLKQRLKTRKSLEAIFAWAVTGAMDWYELKTVGLPVPDEIAEQTEEHRKTMDSIAQFLDQMCIVDTFGIDDSGKLAAFTIGKKLYTEYKSWCEDEGYMPVGRRRFTSSLGQKGIESEVRWDSNLNKSIRGYAGVNLTDDTATASPNGRYKSDKAEGIPW